MLQPKKTKYRKTQKGRMKGLSHRGFRLSNGMFGIKALDSVFLTSRQIEAARVAATRYMKREGQLWIKVFPDKPITKKPLEVRMGKGKGAPEYFVAVAKAGRILFEVSGVSFDVAKEALRLAAQKLPVKTKGIIISSPSNPLGTIIEDTQLRQICDYCVKKNITLISDEIYHGIKYDKNPHKSALNFTSKAVIINSFSKYFLMTGWRLGWIIIDEKYIDTISRLAMNLYLSPPNLSQYTAIELFNHYKYFNQIIDGYKINRKFIIENLKNSGLTDFITPQGAFYIYLNVSSIAKDSYKFCKKMVEDISVTAAPGIDFDEKKGNRFIRLSYATKLRDLEQALKRIKGWI